MRLKFKLHSQDTACGRAVARLSLVHTAQHQDRTRRHASRPRQRPRDIGRRLSPHFTLRHASIWTDTDVPVKVTDLSYVTLIGIQCQYIHTCGVAARGKIQQYPLAYIPRSLDKRRVVSPERPSRMGTRFGALASGAPARTLGRRTRGSAERALPAGGGCRRRCNTTSDALTGRFMILASKGLIRDEGQGPFRM